MDHEDTKNSFDKSPDAGQDTQPVVAPNQLSGDSNSAQPVQAPPSPQLDDQKSVAGHSSPGVIVLQWLTYAFWGWLILALIWLMGVVTSSAIADADVSSMIPYAIAATLVLLPIAFVTDLFYRRHEPTKKSGAATVIMVIHVVIFALLAIGVLIITVFTILSMFVGSGGASEEQTAAIVTGLFATVLYGAAFLRTLNPFKTKKVAQIYGFGMLAVSLIVLALGVFGPMVKAVSERDDRRLETNLPYVQSAITGYVDDNKKLPDALNDLEYRNNDTRSIVDDGLVRYEKVATPQASGTSLLNSYSSRRSSTEYRYKLCVTYKGSSNDDYNDYSSNRDEYSSYLSVYSHPAGEVCYKLSVNDYNY